MHIARDDVTAVITRNMAGFPSKVEVTRRHHKLLAEYDSENGYTLSGDLDLIDALKLIYPFNEKPVLTVPQPLQVQNVQGGNVSLFDDLEGLLKWHNIGVTVALDNTVAFGGSQSLKLTAAAGAIVTARRYFGLEKLGKLSLSFKFLVDTYAKLTDLFFMVTILTGNNNYVATASYDRATRTWRLSDAAQAHPIIIETALPQGVDANGAGWHRFKMVFSLEPPKYISLSIDENTWIGSTIPIAKTIAAAVRSARVDLVVDAEAAQDVNVWFDDVLVTEE